MIGIYKITNKLNNKSYIGQSNDIQRRFSEHCYKNTNSGIPLDIAINKYGKDNFIFEVVEECKIEELNKKETFWIKYYNTVEKGYNCNYGGDSKLIGENNPNSLLTEEEVIFIRKSYANHQKQKDIYILFKDKISFKYFQRIWQGKSWSHIMPEVYTKENKEYYIHSNSKGENSIKSKFTNEEVLEIRKRYVNETAKEIYNDYSNRVKYNTFQNLLWGRTYKEVPIYSKKFKKWING